MTEAVDVAVVGAGLAGLSAAEALQEAGLAIAVLEADDRVGGRTLNYRLGDGKVAELGGQWVGPSQHHLNELAARMGVETYPTYDQGAHVALFGGNRGAYRRAPRLPALGLAESGLVLARLERISRRVVVESPWLARSELDRLSVADWIDRYVRTDTARTMLELLVENVFTCTTADISLLHVLTIVRSAGGFRPLLGVRGGAADRRFVGGSEQLSLGLASRLGPGAVTLGTPVRRVAQTAEKVEVTADGREVTARYAIIAIPPAQAGRIDYDPSMPSIRVELTKRSPMGSVIKCLAVYDEPFWRQEGLNGQGVADQLAVRATFDNSPPDGRPGILVGFVAADQARRLREVSATERQQAVLDSLAALFGPRAAQPREYVEMDWTTKEWIGGCYGAFFAPGVLSAYGPALRMPVGRIHFAGTETATTWIGYMDGAVESGHRAATEVLRRL